MQNANLKTFFVILAAFSLLIMPCSHAVAQNLPGDHSRWIGDIEGEAVDKQGSALVYEFRFNESGKVTVYKHMTVRKLEQTFDFEMVDGDIRISGDSNGSIAELAGNDDSVDYRLRLLERLLCLPEFPQFSSLHGACGYSGSDYRCPVYCERKIYLDTGQALYLVLLHDLRRYHFVFRSAGILR